VLLSAQWGGPNGIEARSLGLLFLQCFDTVGWVFWPIKRVPDMTYNEFGGTLNVAQLNCIPLSSYSDYLSKVADFNLCCVEISPISLASAKLFTGLLCDIVCTILSVAVLIQ